MNALPASIEAYLQEAGFTPTEILILKRLMDVEALTLREIASKTGKSTGVLDQAMRNLTSKGVVEKSAINDTYKFTLVSLQAISHWMVRDMKDKRDAMARKHQNFEEFLATIELDKKKPVMEYFHGSEGIRQAYIRLLDCGKELLQYVPVLCLAEDDPLRDFRVELFRERRKRGIFSRVIAHDTPFGRRFQTRDPYEYRQTLLVSEDVYPFDFEKIICGNAVACFNLPEERACIIHYPEMVAMERGFFEMIWKKSLDEPAVADHPQAAAVSSIPLKTRTLSRLREYFLSRSSFIAMGFLAIAAGLLTYSLYSYTSALNLDRMKTEAQAIANTSAYNFSTADLDQLRKQNDWHKPEWAKVVEKLRSIRVHNDDVMFAYIYRKASSANTLEFVADSHSINPFANTDADSQNDVDANNDGRIDVDGPDKLQWPGQSYPTPPPEAFAAFNGPTTNQRIYTDAWGSMISGYAPIKNPASGKTEAVLAIDIRASKLAQLNAQVFAPLLYFIGIFILFILIRLTAFNRSLFKEMYQVLNLRKVLITVALLAEIALGATLLLYWSTLSSIKKEAGNRLMSIAATAAPTISVDDINQLHFARDMKKDAYQRIFKKLNQIRDNNADIKYVYIFRPVQLPHLWEFVVDADSNFNVPYLWKDFNNDGTLDMSDVNVSPGVRYYGLSLDSSRLLSPSFSNDFYIDQWGTILSGFAPIKDAANNPIGVLGMDVDISQVLEEANKKFTISFVFIGIFCFLVLIKILLTKTK